MSFTSYLCTIVGGLEEDNIYYFLHVIIFRIYFLRFMKLFSNTCVFFENILVILFNFEIQISLS